MPVTVGELKKLLKGLPNGMTVVLEVYDELVDICLPNIRIADIEVTDIVDQEIEIAPFLILPQCTCVEDEIMENGNGEINSKPELN